MASVSLISEQPSYKYAVFYILIFTMWPSDSKSSRLHEAGVLYPVLRYDRRTLKEPCRRKDMPTYM